VIAQARKTKKDLIVAKHPLFPNEFAIFDRSSKVSLYLLDDSPSILFRILASTAIK
jgi:hypothetical protein